MSGVKIRPATTPCGSELMLRRLFCNLFESRQCACIKYLGCTYRAIRNPKRTFDSTPLWNLHFLWYTTLNTIHSSKKITSQHQQRWKVSRSVIENPTYPPHGYLSPYGSPTIRIPNLYKSTSGQLSIYLPVMPKRQSHYKLNQSSYNARILHVHTLSHLEKAPCTDIYYF